MSETARVLITNTLLDLGVLADGETPSASQANGALRKLNNLLDAWNIQDLMVYGSYPNVFPLVADQGIYTLGTGGDFNISLPNNIQNVYIRDLNQPITNRLDIPVYMLSQNEYQDLPFKSWQQTYPFGVYIDGSFPLSNVYLNPVPSTNQYSLVIWTGGVLQNVALDTVMNLPSGYQRALESNLAIELSPSYGVQISDATAKIAREAVADIKVKNFTINELQAPGLAQYNILSNTYDRGW